MPCRDYEDDHRSSMADSDQRDRLARIACKAMQELERQGTQDFLLLRDEEVRQWWEAHKIADAKATAERAERQRREQERLAAKQRRAELKARALAKLDPDEIKALGVKL